jgi:hypothetical protein
MQRSNNDDRASCSGDDLVRISAPGLLAAATVHGLKVFADGPRLVVRGPRTADAKLVNTLLARKSEVMPLLQPLDVDEQEYFDERAGIAEFDGGLKPTEAERLALEEVLDRRWHLGTAADLHPRSSGKVVTPFDK